MQFRRRSWTRKFADAVRGLYRAVRSQSSFFIHLWAAAAVIAVAAVLRVSLVEWCLLAGAIGIVLVAEIFNTAIESLARALNTGRHPRVRDALDMASAGVLLSAIVAVIIGGGVFGQRAGRMLGLW
jgi:diacylglycerol kinase (ATP)